MVFLYIEAGVGGWIIFIIVLIWIISKLGKKNPAKSNEKKEKKSDIILAQTIIQIVEKPKIITEFNEEGNRNLSSTIPTNVEEITLYIVEDDNGKLEVDIHSYKLRKPNSGKYVFLRDVDEKHLYTVAIPPDIEEFTLSAHVEDHKISVELENVTMKDTSKQ